MSIRQVVKFKKRNVAGQCRAMRCKGDTELQEFDRPEQPTVLLCPKHHDRAVEHNDAPTVETPPPATGAGAAAVLVTGHPAVRTAVDGATGNPIYTLDDGTTWLFGEPPDEPAYDESAHALAEANERALADALATSQSSEPWVETPEAQASRVAFESAEAAAKTHPDMSVERLEVVEVPPAGATTVVVEHSDVTALVGPLAAEWEPMAAQLVGFVVNDQETVDSVGALLLQVKAKLAELEKGRMRIVRPLLDAKIAVDGLFRPATSAAKKIEGMLKGALGAYNDRQQAAQVQALAAGDHAAALAVEQPTMPAGVSTVTVWRWRVINAALVPDAYKVIDSAKVQTRVNQMKGACDIPGVEAFPETGVRAATK